MKVGVVTFPGSLDDADAAWQLPVAAMQFTRVELMETMQSVARLPVEQREVLVLAAIEELRYDEIATVMGIPVGTVMSRVCRARAAMRHFLEGRDRTGAAPALRRVV